MALVVNAVGSILGFCRTLCCVVANELGYLLEFVRPRVRIVADTAHGQVAGYVRGETAVFKGIPYAADVYGEWRWKAPRDPTPWTGVRECVEFSAPCPQPATPFCTASYSTAYCLGDMAARALLARVSPARGTHVGSDHGCLSVNVWTSRSAVGAKAGAAGKKLPVMVYVHGGAFVVGCGGPPLFCGESFVESGCVLVTMHYRLGLLGYLNVPGSDSNRGLRDVLHSLRWVRENIASFGGDASNVTLFGESAGAMTVAPLMTSKLRFVEDENGGRVSLFQKVICMSGAAHHTQSKVASEHTYRRVMETLPEGTTAEDLATLPHRVLIKAQVRVGDENSKAYLKCESDSMLRFRPWIDGDVLDEHPLAAVEKGATADLAVLAGTTQHEYAFFSSFLMKKKHDLNASVPKRLQALLRQHDDDEGLATRVHEAYAASAYARDFAGHSTHNVYNALLTDWVFRLPCERLAAAHSAAGGRAHVYQYTHADFGSKWGVCHVSELPHLFGTARHFPVLYAGKAQAREVRAVLQETWTGFAAGTRGSAWPQFTADTRGTLRVDASGVEEVWAPYSDITAAWGDLKRYDHGPQ